MIMPFPGDTFKVNASELTLGPGTITVLENGLLFEASNHGDLGFDFNTIRLVKVTDINSFDVAYSIRGSIRKASFVTIPKYIRKNEGIEKDVSTDPLGWTMTFWKLHTITGAVVARALADRSGAKGEGFTPISDEELESQSELARELVETLPSQEEIASGNAASGEEPDDLEQQLTDIFLRLTDAWLLGNLSQRQRESVAAMNYRDQLKRYEQGWSHATATKFCSRMTNLDYKENAEDWLSEESRWGSNLLEFARGQDSRP
jgi:hypothetical protein